MTEKELNQEYFNWMCQLVCDKRWRNKGLSYQMLLSQLHSIDFQYTLPMDENRAEDGIDLRYRFGYEKEYEGSLIRKSAGPDGILIKTSRSLMPAIYAMFGVKS